MAVLWLSRLPSDKAVVVVSLLNLLSLHKEGVVVSWLNILSVHTAGVVVSWIIYCHYIKKVWWFPG